MFGWGSNKNQKVPHYQFIVHKRKSSQRPNISSASSSPQPTSTPPPPPRWQRPPPSCRSAGWTLQDFTINFYQPIHLHLRHHHDQLAKPVIDYLELEVQGVPVLQSRFPKDLPPHHLDDQHKLLLLFIQVSEEEEQVQSLYVIRVTSRSVFRRVPFSATSCLEQSSYWSIRYEWRER